MITTRELDVIRLRYVEKKSMRVIATVLGISIERTRQLLIKALKGIMYEEEVAKWKRKTGIDHLSEDLIQLIYMIDPELIGRVKNLIWEWNIRDLSDFRRVNLKNPRTKSIGVTTALKIKLALLKLGVPYDQDDFETIQRKLEGADVCDIGLKLRFKIYNRDNFTCQYCGRSPRKDPEVVLHADHITPVSKGGGNHENNMITACRECNLGKADTPVNLHSE